MIGEVVDNDTNLKLRNKTNDDTIDIMNDRTTQFN